MTRAIAVVAALLLGAQAQAASLQHAAEHVRDPQGAPLLAMAQAGPRVVTAGDHGMVLLSDDDGRSFRQAQDVPTQALLTSLSFVDAQHGWAAGHDGVIIATEDGGEHWRLQHEDTDGDRVLFSIRFSDAAHGYAVGLFGLALRTEDGGQHWQEFHPVEGEDGDLHLYALFGKGPLLLIAAERGTVLRSEDSGAHWQAIHDVGPGSLWAGAVLADGSLLVAGQRGHVLRSGDQGQHWQEVAAGTTQSLTAIAQAGNGRLHIAGLAGTQLASDDGGEHWGQQSLPDRVPLTGVLVGKDAQSLWIGAGGVQR